MNLAAKSSIFSRASPNSGNLKFHLRRSLDNIKAIIFAQTDFPKQKQVQGHGEEDTDKDDLDFSMNPGLAPESSSDEMSIEDLEDNDPVIISNVEVRRVHDHIYLVLGS